MQSASKIHDRICFQGANHVKLSGHLFPLVPEEHHNYQETAIEPASWPVVEWKSTNTSRHRHRVTEKTQQSIKAELKYEPRCAPGYQTSRLHRLHFILSGFIVSVFVAPPSSSSTSTSSLPLRACFPRLRAACSRRAHAGGGGSTHAGLDDSEAASGAGAVKWSHFCSSRTGTTAVTAARGRERGLRSSTRKHDTNLSVDGSTVELIKCEHKAKGWFY